VYISRSYGYFGTIYWFPLQGSSPLRMGQRGCPETSVTNYETRLRNISEKGGLSLHRSRSLKSRKVFIQKLVGHNPKKFPTFCVNNVHYPVHNRPPNISNLSQMNPVHTLSHSTSLISHSFFLCTPRCSEPPLSYQNYYYYYYLSSLSYEQHVLH